MNRAFVSLYLIIVLSIVLLGLVLNKFWDEVNPPMEIDPAVIDLIGLIETSLKNSQLENKAERLEQATKGLSYQAKLLSVSNFSKTDIAEKIKQGSVVSVNDDSSHYFYKRILNSDDVLVLAHPVLPANRNGFYLPFIFLLGQSPA